MIILGINYMFHDSSACILKDGELVVALEEERFTRNKHDVVFPHHSVQECLRVANLTLDDIDHIAISFKPTLDMGRKIGFILKHPSKLIPNINLHLLRYYWRYRTINKWFKNTFKGQKKTATSLYTAPSSAHCWEFLCVTLQRSSTALYGWLWGVGDSINGSRS